MWNRFISDAMRNNDLQMAVKWQSKESDCKADTAGALKDNKVTFAEGAAICSRLH